MKNVLLEDWWKQARGRSAELGVKFVSEPPSVPENIAVPELKLCKIVENDTLGIPTDVRQRWLRDPIRSKEWRDMLTKFDRIHAPIAGQAPVTQQADDSQGEASSADSAVQDFWAGVFPDATKSLQVLEQGTVSATFPLPNSPLVVKVIEGPQFFLCATTAAATLDTSGPLFTHGGGTWLLDSKATKALEDTWVVC